MILQTVLTIFGFMFNPLTNNPTYTLNYGDLNVVCRLNDTFAKSDEAANTYFTISNDLEILGTLEYVTYGSQFRYTINEVNVYCSVKQFYNGTISSYGSFDLSLDEPINFVYAYSTERDDSNNFRDFIDTINQFSITMELSDYGVPTYTFSDGVNSYSGTTNFGGFGDVSQVQSYQTSIHFDYDSLISQFNGINYFNILGDDFYNEGYHDGYEDGYDIGYADGYGDGVNVDGTTATIFNGIMTIGLTPINFFLGIFNFNILGINITGFVTALLSVCLVIIVLRLFTGSNAKG